MPLSATEDWRKNCIQGVIVVPMSAMARLMYEASSLKEGVTIAFMTSFQGGFARKPEIT
jgi:hypothetical protein